MHAVSRPAPLCNDAPGFVGSKHEKVDAYVQYLDEWNLSKKDIPDEFERILPHPLTKKKMRIEKHHGTEQKRIESYMSKHLSRQNASLQMIERISDERLFRALQKEE